MVAHIKHHPDLKGCIFGSILAPHSPDSEIRSLILLAILNHAIATIITHKLFIIIIIIETGIVTQWSHTDLDVILG